MEDVKTDRVKDIAIEYLEGTWLHENGDGTFTCHIYADYRDEMSSETASEILTSDDPMGCLAEKVTEWFFLDELSEKYDLQKNIIDALNESGEFSDEEMSEAEDKMEELIGELVIFEYPIDKYLDQKFLVDIMVDTGDGNYDYTLNSVYPCYAGEEGETIDSKASIVWLSKTQGYSKMKMKQEIGKGDVSEPEGFLQSLRQELANLPSHMSILTFLVEMSLVDLIELNKGIQLQERNGRFYDATKVPYCGYIVLDKRTETGLYDPWSGGGSVFEIQLEKDVRLPIRFIRSALPDGGDGRYSVESTYGMCHSAWRPDMVKKIHLPMKYA